MAKKKKPASKKKASGKTAVQKKSSAKTTSRKKKAAAKKTTAVKKAARASKSAATPTATSAPASLGRPLVTADEKLYLLFKEDYHARQIFEFLRVETVRELEQYSPQEIVRLLSQPIRRTVDHIRRKLAAKNRCLAGDEEFAAKYKEQASTPDASH